MEDPRHSRDAGVGREFRTEFPLQQACETGEDPSEDDPAAIQRRADDLRLRLEECGSEVFGILRDGPDLSILQFGGDVQEHSLAIDLLLDERRNHAKLLYTLDLDARAARDRDVQIL